MREIFVMLEWFASDLHSTGSLFIFYTLLEVNRIYIYKEINDIVTYYMYMILPNT